MKRATVLYILLMASLISFGMLGTVTYGQKIIEPNAGYVNEIIKADVNAQGKQIDSVFIFRRGQSYYLNNMIENVGYSITLKAEDGTGALPKLLNTQDATGALNRMFSAGDNAYIYNLFIDGMGPNLSTGDPDPYYLMNGQLLRANAAGKELIIDGCILMNAGQVLIRSNAGARKVQVTNTILANCGQLSADNIGNGRILDMRNGVTDTVIFRNCTMINTYDRIIRHYGAAANSTTAFVKYLECDHNTIVHNLGAYGYFFLGDVQYGAKITNNLFYNPMTLGYEPVADPQRLAEVSLIGEKDSTTGTYLFPLIMDQPNTNSNPQFTITKNVITYDSDVKKYFSTNKVAENPVVSLRIASMIGSSQVPATKADITLKKIPNNMISIMNWYHANAILTVGGGMITDGKIDMDRRSRKFWSDTLDCSYTTSSQLFKGSDGKAIGSSMWKSTITGLEDTKLSSPKQYALSNNYPNPFNPTTKIDFSVASTSNVTLKVFNLLGQEVRTLIQGQMEPGTHSVNFNASGIPSGIYIYTLNASASDGKMFSFSKKMTILK
ncbi:MAG: T9SS type A sorting domain-containing protein [Clostridiales bacterium]